MCLIFISLKAHPTYKLIVAANRDEFYERKTAPARYWEDHRQILGGRDIEAGGTWLGMTPAGRISMVTNYRDLKNIRPDAPSRGHLVSDYLLGSGTARHYLQELRARAKQYNGFNLIAGTADDLWYCSNYKEDIDQLGPGHYGLSNHLLDTPWPKVAKGKAHFSRILSGPFDEKDLFTLLLDDQIAADNELPDTGVGIERERALSSMFIKSPGYGTRSSTVVLVTGSGSVSFTERVYDLTTFDFIENAFTFKI